MFVEKIHLASLHNEEHTGLISYASEYAKDIDPQKGNIATQLTDLDSQLELEKLALDQVQKNSLTQKANAADAVCDNALRGLFGHVKNQLNHFDPLVAEAAYGVNVICESFKDLPSRGRNSQTQGEEQLLNELEKVKADVETIGLTGWVNHLKDAHKAYLAVNTNRNAEDDSKPEINMRIARLTTDVAYKALVDRINAYITIDGGAAYTSFVTRLNGRIADYNATIAKRKGRNKKDDTDTTK